MKKGTARLITLRDKEKIYIVIRKHWTSMVLRILIGVVLFCLPFFLMFTLISRGPIGVSVFLALLVTAAIYISREGIRWYDTVFIITNQRILDIDKGGYFKKVVSEVSLAKITDVHYVTSGIVQAIFRLGDITVKTQGEAVQLQMDAVVHPDDMVDLIVESSTEVGGDPQGDDDNSEEDDSDQDENDGGDDREKLIKEFLSEDEEDTPQGNEVEQEDLELNDSGQGDVDDLVTEFIEENGEDALREMLMKKKKNESSFKKKKI